MAHKRKRTSDNKKKNLHADDPLKKKIKKTPISEEKEETYDSSSEQEFEEEEEHSTQEEESENNSSSSNDELNNDTNEEDSDIEQETDDPFQKVNKEESENEEEDGGDDKEANEIKKLQEKRMKKMEKYLPGYNKKQQETKETPRLPAFDDEKTRSQFAENIARILSTSVPATDKWSFSKAKLPILALAKGKAKQLINEEKKNQEFVKKRAEKHNEDNLILTRNHILPSLATFAFEKKLKAIATRGVVKLLNEVAQQRRNEQQLEEQIDDYTILKKVPRSGKRRAT